jgi:hypothetical protein
MSVEVRENETPVRGAVEVERGGTSVASGDEGQAGSRTFIKEENLKEEKRAVGGAFVAAINDVRLLLIALWLGGAVYFSATVAPSAFGVLRALNVPHANEAAGSIVSRTLAMLNTSGFVISLVLLATAFLFRGTVKRKVFLSEIISLGLVAITTGVGQWIIAARMLALRHSMSVPIDEVAKDNPLHVAFDSLHSASVATLGIGIIAAAVALLLIARHRRTF